MLGIIGGLFASTQGKTRPAGRNRQVKIQSLPYLGSTPVLEGTRDRIGVTVHDASLAASGITLVCTSWSDRARFIDMQGRVLHEIDVGDPRGCKLLEPYGPSDFIAMIAEKRALKRITWDSKVVWHLQDRPFHHDVAISPEGDIITLSSAYREITHRGAVIPIWDDEIVVLSPQGKIKRSFPLFEIVNDFVPPERLDALRAVVQRGERPLVGDNQLTDILHTNTLEILPRNTVLGKKGQFLVCLRNINLVAVIDISKKKVVWSWGQKDLDYPHHPTLLPGGNILVFDNGTHRNRSRVIMVDPTSKKIVWTYQAPDFFSFNRGSSELLPNGNVLIGESFRGRMFEVTPQGKTVWEYWTPVAHDLPEQLVRPRKRPDGLMRPRIRRLAFYRTRRFFQHQFHQPPYAALWKKLGQQEL